MNTLNFHYSGTEKTLFFIKFVSRIFDALNIFFFKKKQLILYFKTHEGIVALSKET